MATRRAILGNRHPEVLISRANLAGALQAQGRYAEAEEELRRVLAHREEDFRPDHPATATARNNLATVLTAQGKTGEAVKQLRLAIPVWEAALGPTHAHVFGARANLAQALLPDGKYAEVVAELRPLLAQALAADLDPRSTATIRRNLGVALAERGDYPGAEEQLRGALSLRVSSLGLDHPDVAAVRSHLAAVLLEQGAEQDALQQAELAWDRARSSDVPPETQAYAAFVLARTRWRTGDPGQRRTARALAERALQTFAGLPAGAPDEIDEVRTWLRQLPAADT